MVWVALLAWPVALYGQEQFSVTSLPLDFVDGADVVVRLDEQVFDVSGPGRATEQRRFVATIFRASGQPAGTRPVFYDQFRRIKKLDGRLLDATGKQIRKLGRRDIEDVSATSGINLYDDSRARVATLRHDVYPYTVEFSYEVEHRGLLSWPTWYPQGRTVPVERASFQLRAPLEVGARYRQQYLDVEPERSEQGNRETLLWTVSMLPGWDREPLSPDEREHRPVVWTAPTTFEIDGYRGEAATWEGFGAFYATLSDGRQRLPEAARADVQRLVSGVEDDREKVRLLYQYLQGRTRYVSIQLGIGGWQPFDAVYVHERQYGDCKALTNYMQALLAEAGIASYPALIRAGRFEAPVLSDFPSNQFNHAILYVPLETDTLWLEATSQTNAFAHLGAFTEDREALVVHPEGSFLARTPVPTAEDNRQQTDVRVQLTGTGSALADLEIRYQGESRGRVMSMLHGRSARDRMEWLRESLAIASFDVNAADFSSIDARADTVRLAAQLVLQRFGSLTGSRLFIPLNAASRGPAVPDALSTPRTQPVVLAASPFIDEMTVDFELPVGFVVEALPEPVTLSTPFGRYEARAEVGEGEALRFVRRFELTQTRVAPEAYEDVRAFLQHVARADRAQMVLRKN